MVARKVISLAARGMRVALSTVSEGTASVSPPASPTPSGAAEEIRVRERSKIGSARVPPEARLRTDASSSPSSTKKVSSGPGFTTPSVGEMIVRLSGKF